MLNTITVQELIDRLSDEDPDAKVIFASGYGDRGNTQQAHGLRGRCEEVVLTESCYSDSGWAVSRDDDGDGEKFVRIS